MSEDDPLTLPSSQIPFDEMIDPLVHRLADFSVEATAADRGLFGQKLAIDPGGTRRRDLRVDPEVRPRRKRQPLAAAGVVVGPRLNNGPGLGVACQLANSIRSNGSDEIASELSDRTRARRAQRSTSSTR